MADAVISSLKQIQRILARARQGCTMGEAKKLCKGSRYLHIDVWEDFFPKKVVEKVVLKSMYNARKVLKKLIAGGLNANDLEQATDFLDNLNARIENIENNYLHGKLSKFLPNDRLKELLVSENKEY